MPDIVLGIGWGKDMATMLNRSIHTKSTLVVIWAVLMAGAIIAAIMATDYPPLGRLWEIRALIWAFVGSLAGILVASLLRRLIIKEGKKAPGFFAITSIIGLVTLWALIVAGFLHNLPPGQSAFTIPTSPGLYLALIAIVAFAAFFWLLLWGSEIAPGLMLVMLAGTAGGVMFNLHGAATDTLFLLMAALWAGRVWCLQGQPSMSHPLVGGGLLLIVLVILAGTFGVYPGNSYRLALRMSSGWIVAMGIVSARTEKERDIMPALLASGIMLAILTLARYFMLVREVDLGYAVTLRLWLAGANPNALASALLLTISVLFIITPKSTIGKVLWASVLILTLLMIFLSLSKAVWLGLILLFVLGFLISNKNLKRNLVITLVIVLLGMVVVFAVPSISARFMDEFSFSSRIVIWQTVLGNISHHLLLGVGPGNSFVHAAFVNTLPYEQIFPMREYFGGHSHNIWLELTEGIGLVGMAVFLWMVFILIRRAGKERSWLISGLIGLFLTLSLSIGLSVNQFLPLELWVFLGLIAVPNVRGRRWHFAFTGIVIILAISGSVSDALKRQADQWSFRGLNDRAMWRLNTAALLNPWDASIPEKQAQLAMADSDQAAMLGYYNRCVALAPGHPVLRARRGMVRMLMGDAQGARRDLEEAIAGDDFGILAGDLHAPLAVVYSAVGDVAATNAELHRLTMRDPFFPQGPWSALLEVNDGWNTILCPDFQPGGNKDEQKRRVLYWLGSNGISRSALRRVYPAGTKAYSYTDAVDEEMASNLILAPSKEYLAPFKTYEIGLSYFQMCRFEGKEGTDLSALFGGMEKIPPGIITQVNSTMAIIKAPELYKLTLCLGLARAAQLAKKNAEYEAFMNEAMRIADELPGDIVAKYKRMGEEDKVIWPESVSFDLARAKTDANKADFVALATDLDGYFRMAILTQMGWDNWEDVARFLIKMKADGDKVIDDIMAEYPDEALPVIVKAYLARNYGDKDTASALYKKAQILADGNRVIVKACCEGYFAIGDTKNGIEAADYYKQQWLDDLITLASFQKVILNAGLIDQAQKWLKDLEQRFPYSADLALMKADYYDGLREWAANERNLLKAREFFPTSAPIRAKLARFYYTQGAKDKAVAEYYAALNIDPGDIGSRIGLADIYADRGDYNIAVSLVEYAHRIAPGDAWSNVSLGAMLSRAGRKQEALALLEAFLQQQPEAWDAVKWHAKIAEELGMADVAYADYNRLISAGQGDMSIYIKMAEQLLAQGKMEQALDMLIKGTQVDPANDWGWETLGYMITQADFFEQIEDWLSYLAAKNPNVGDLEFLKTQLGILNKDPNLYKTKVSEALQKYPQSPAIKAAWGLVLYREEKLSEAEKSFGEALVLDPNDLCALTLKSSIALRQKNSAAAIDYATRAQKTAPTSAWANVALAQALDAGGQSVQAIGVLDGYLTTNPDSRYARQWRARMNEKLGNSQKALADYELLVNLRKGDLTACTRVAEAKLAQDKAGEAAAIMEIASRLYPRDAWAWATYGEMLRRAGDVVKARAALNKAVKLDPANPNYPKLLESIPIN
jgi:tetratricopeptide (TPR) repeat protein